METIKVLDKGYVRLLGHMGDDLDLSNDARASYDGKSTTFTQKDADRIARMGKGGHTSPFRGQVAKFETYGPLMVSNQLHRYIVASLHVDEQFQWDELSRRYVSTPPEFHVPQQDQWRKAGDKPGQSAGTLGTTGGWAFTTMLEQHQYQGADLYRKALGAGIVPEQARLFLAGYGVYVRWRWTVSLQAICHAISQRIDKHAQWETQEYAHAALDLVAPIWPYATRALLKGPAPDADVMQALQDALVYCRDSGAPDALRNDLVRVIARWTD